MRGKVAENLLEKMILDWWLIEERVSIAQKEKEPWQCGGGMYAWENIRQECVMHCGSSQNLAAQDGEGQGNEGQSLDTF